VLWWCLSKNTPAQLVPPCSAPPPPTTAQGFQRVRTFDPLLFRANHVIHLRPFAVGRKREAVRVALDLRHPRASPSLVVVSQLQKYRTTSSFGKNAGVLVFSAVRGYSQVLSWWEMARNDRGLCTPASSQAVKIMSQWPHFHDLCTAFSHVPGFGSWLLASASETNMSNTKAVKPQYMSRRTIISPLTSVLRIKMQTSKTTPSLFPVPIFQTHPFFEKWHRNWRRGRTSF
jgi:hypothetical protein